MRCDEDDLEELKELNENLDLSRDTRALRTLVVLDVGMGTLTAGTCDLDRVDSYDAIGEETPCWLWYADQETRRKDIQDLILYCVERKAMAVG